MISARSQTVTMHARRESKRLARLQEYQAYILRLDSRGVALCTYPCPSCQAEIKTPRPGQGDCYTSLTNCPYCEGAHFKVVRDDGSVETEIVNLKQERSHAPRP